MSYNDEDRNEFDDDVERGLAGTGKAAGIQLIKLAKIALVKFISFVGIPLAILIFLIIFGYFFIYENIGTQKEYIKDFRNDAEFSEEGYYLTDESLMNAQNKTVRDFYKYFASQSFTQVSLDEYEKTKEFKYRRIDDYEEDDDKIIDFYNREDQFKLNENMLFALDSRLYKDFKFPEQLIKGVAFDEETKKLKDITDKKGFINVESKQRNRVTGQDLKKTEKSVKDYGLASVLFYREGIRNLTVEGTYELEDYWDGNGVSQRPITEPFVVQLHNFDPEKIHVIENAVTMAGNIEYKYEDKKQHFEFLKPGKTSIEGEPMTEYHYANHYDYRHCKGDPDCEPVIYPLYKYRSDDSAVIEEAPRVVDTIEEPKGNKYFEDYVSNFETYIPNDVMTDKELIDRIDYDSSAFDGDYSLADLSGAVDFGVGSGIEKGKFKNALEYEDLFVKYGSMFGVDPYIMMALATQESGANPKINKDGMMQIDDAHNNQTITMSDTSGKPQSLKITAKTKTQPEPSIMWATMRFKSLLDKHNGNPYKAIQEYNFGSGTMKNLEKVSGPAWETETGWLIYREKARRNVAPSGKASASYGCMPFPEGELPSKKGNLFADSCYLENVLQYYAGGNIENVENSGFWNKMMSFTGSMLSKLSEFLRTPFRLELNDDTPINLSEYKPVLEWDEDITIIKMTNALNDQELFSRVSGDAEETISLFNSDFIEQVGNIGKIYVQVKDSFSLGHYSPSEIMSMFPNKGGYGSPIDMSKTNGVSSKYGPRNGGAINTGKGSGSDGGKASSWHRGVDVSGMVGTPIYAIADGKVVESGTSSSKGMYMWVQHDNGTRVQIMHCSGFFIREGRVKKGDPIAKLGNTGRSSGPHMHFEFWVSAKEHIDPAPFLYGIK